MLSLSFVLVQPGKRATAASKHRQRVGIHSHAQKVTQQRRRERHLQETEKQPRSRAAADNLANNDTVGGAVNHTYDGTALGGTVRYIHKYPYDLPTPSPEPDSLSIFRPLSNYSSWSEDNKYGVNIYMHVTVLDINENATNMTFWREDVPALSGMWTCIRDIISAIAAANQAIQDRNNVLILTAFELHHKALAGLRRDVVKLPLSAQVACCLLFDAFNLLRCDFVLAGDQIAVAKKLTSDLQLDEYLKDEKLPTVCDALVRMEQTSAWSLWSPSNFLRYESLRHTEPNLHLDLQPVREANVCLKSLIESMGRLSRHLSGRIRRNLSQAAFVDPSSRLARDVLHEFDNWKLRYDLHVSRQEHSEERATLQQAEMAWNFTFITFNTGVIGCGELEYDDPRYLRYYNRINELAQQRFSESVNYSRHATIKVFLQIITPSLWLIVLMCRDPQVRARSIYILNSRHYQEGEYDSIVTGQMAQTVVDIETGRRSVYSACDVPLERRICVEGIKYIVHSEQVVLSYSFAGQIQTDATIHTEYIPWRLEGDLIKFNNAISALSQVCTLYRKSRANAAPAGYIKPMFYKGELVPVISKSSGG